MAEGTMLKVLIVDDSEPFRKVMSELLIRAGVTEVFEADSFEQGVEQFRKNKPQFTFVDMIMPGKNGVELTKELLAVDPSATVIAMSSIINKTLIRQSLDAGAKDFLLKPTNAIALSSVLAMWSD